MGQRSFLRYGMVGGSLSSFMGNVHRTAIGFERDVILTAGCFSSRDAVNLETGEALGLDPARVYLDFSEMARVESERDDGIDFVVIVTPNNVHYEAAKAFLEHGINVVCEKPLCIELDQALALEKLADESGVLFAVTYAYTGYAMAKLARQMIKEGKIGEVINVNAEYLQEWLLSQVGDSGESLGTLSTWRTDPNKAGNSNCVGDIGTHIESIVSYMTGLEIKRVSARVDRFGHTLDLNANILVEYSNGCPGLYTCSQVSAGYGNALAVRIFGSKGAIEWKQESPDELRVTLLGQPVQTYYRGTDSIYGRAAQVSRIPSGHPEGYYVAFANTYKIYTNAVRKKLNGEPLMAEDLDFPTIRDGVAGVKFITATMESGRKDSAWVEL
ncbi:MAG: Gfo/Idh/MocA family oxidoreductase [Oscillospiraceae bacterium]|jgi:predicted dehydrogenase|nr:Gfo/Idh/MocA family oxidoreductase [Oscillospiraceae bacterium]